VFQTDSSVFLTHSSDFQTHSSEFRTHSSDSRTHSSDSRTHSSEFRTHSSEFQTRTQLTHQFENDESEDGETRCKVENGVGTSDRPAPPVGYADQPATKRYPLGVFPHNR
jgi:hypothetical protein